MCHFDLPALHFSSGAHELLCMDSIWRRHMCYMHHFSGDWLMPLSPLLIQEKFTPPRSTSSEISEIVINLFFFFALLKIN